MSTTPSHVPVMLRRCLDLLAPALSGPDAVVVDATLGLGGHSEALLSEFPGARLVAIDRDPAALKLSADRLAPYGDRATLVHAVYDELPEVLARLGIAQVQGVLFDLGVSSMQLDEADRGFAYAQDAPLDMRILRSYGEEKFARKIVDAVVKERAKEPFTDSARLVDLIRAALPQAAKRTGGNPAKRTFQALRIEVNGELAAVERAIPAAVAALAVGGRIAVLSYQSLEDRLVKQVFAAGAANTAPPGLPVVPEKYQPRLKLLTRGAELPKEDEIAENRRAAPARLRGAERIRAEVER